MNKQQSIFALKQKSENIIRGKIQQYDGTMKFNILCMDSGFYLEIWNPYGTAEAVFLFNSALTSVEAETMKQHLMYVAESLRLLYINK
jgi:hypothetical protein